MVSITPNFGNACVSCGEPFSRVAPPLDFRSSNVYAAAMIPGALLSDLDASIIRDTVIPDVTRGIASVQEELERIDAARAQMEAEKTRLQTILLKSKQLVLRMPHLPVETLVDIFEQCCHTEERFHILDRTRGPWVLSCVSKQWRTIVLNTSSLWSVLDFHIPFCGGRVTSKLPQIVNLAHINTFLPLVLTRSGTHSLSIHLSLRSYLMVTDFSLTRDLRCLELLMPHSTRWRHFYLEGVLHHGDEFHMAQEMLDSVDPTTSFPWLRSLGLELSASMADTTPGTITAFGAAPQLSRVEIVNADEYDVAIPHSQLTYVRLAPFVFTANNMARVYQILAKCPNLRFLKSDSWNFRSMYAPQPLPSSTIVSSQLRELSIVIGDAASQLCFSAPLLEDMVMELPIFGEDQLGAIAAFFKRSSFPLRRLRLSLNFENTPGDDTLRRVLQIRDILDLAPSLQDVYLRADYIAASGLKFDHEDIRVYMDVLRGEALHQRLPHLRTYKARFGDALLDVLRRLFRSRGSGQT